MKLFRLGVAAAAAALVAGAGAVAGASEILDGWYSFRATDGDHALDGSSVRFQNDQIVSWYMSDYEAPLGRFASLNPLPLTPIVSSLTEFGFITDNSWYFTINSTLPDAFGAYPYFEGTNYQGGSLIDNYGDPHGEWTLVPKTPDASGTWLLLVGAVTALGACKAFLRGRAAARL